MARSDLILNLVTAARQGDTQLLRRSVEALAAEERAQNHALFAERLEQTLHQNGATNGAPPRSAPADDIANLIYEVTPRRLLADLILSESVTGTCHEIVEEHQRAGLLSSYGVQPRHRLLLIGPPGNGKTSLAEALAHELMMPLYAVRYEGVIGSFLGETAARLSKLFDFVRTRRAVLFFDEFDAIAKERGDTHDTGEVKRVVSSLLLQIDTLPSNVVVIAATNHAELLDRAAWRRFQVRLTLPPPTPSQKSELIGRLLAPLGSIKGNAPALIGRQLQGLSFGELEDFTSDVIRRYVLALPGADLSSVLRRELRRWKTQALLGAADGG